MKSTVKRLMKEIHAHYKLQQAVITRKSIAVWCAIVTMPTVQSFAESYGGAGGYDIGDGVVTEWPWTKFLNSLADQLTGPLPMILGILGIAAAAIGMFMGNHGSGMQKLLVLIFAVSICLFAPSFIGFMRTGVGGATIFGV